MFEGAEPGHWILAVVVSLLITAFVSWVKSQMDKSGHYSLDCKYPGCIFKIDVSDEKYSYICDDIMADHQNREHPLEFKETY